MNLERLSELLADGRKTRGKEGGEGGVSFRNGMKWSEAERNGEEKI